MLYAWPQHGMRFCHYYCVHSLTCHLAVFVVNEQHADATNIHSVHDIILHADRITQLPTKQTRHSSAAHVSLKSGRRTEGPR